MSIIAIPAGLEGDPAGHPRMGQFPPPLALRHAMWIYIRALILLAITVVAGKMAAQEVSTSDDCPSGVHEFLQRNCFGCHEGSEAEAGLDLAAIDSNLGDATNLQRWVRLFDRVADGEMPPKDDGELDPQERRLFIEETTRWISHSQRLRFAATGRVTSRRLTNLQLERTLHDLLAIDLPLAELLPEEPRTDGFDRIADTQSMSHFLLESHLSVVDAALDAATERVLQSDRPPSDAVREYTSRALARDNPRQRCRDPEMIDGAAVVWSSNLAFYGRISSTTVRESGWYRITFSASALNSPSDHGVWCAVRSGRCTSGAPLMSWIGSFEATGEPSEHTMQAWLPRGHMLEIRPADATLKDAKFQGGQVGAGEGGPQRVPGVALHHMQIARIYPGGDVELVKRRLFGDMAVEVDRNQRVIAYRGDEPFENAGQQLRSFSRRAFRRPVTDEDLRPYLAMLRDAIEQGEEPVDALRASYRAVLCSPRFLYFVEPVGPLDDHAIASRLSYLLWNSMPDGELFRLAREGKLHDSGTRHGQVERMLQGEKGLRFVKDFASQWLDLVEIDFTEPDQKLYRDFDLVVQNAMLDETHAFLQSMLDQDASVTQLVDADYTFLNSRLARYYEIDGIQGTDLRRVKLARDSHRGGLMAQGAILKVTANGTNTSPVLRGIWVSERILGTPIPPPPENVPAVEPDIRGAKTIREQLQRHLSDSSCAGCHDKIDPPGYALENFDAAGRWRDAYARVENGQSRRGSTIDASFRMPDGREFRDFNEFRSLLTTSPESIARNVAEKLLVYGTGAPIAFCDRAPLQEVVHETADGDYGLRSLLHAVVASPVFLHK